MSAAQRRNTRSNDGANDDEVDVHALSDQVQAMDAKLERLLQAVGANNTNDATAGAAGAASGAVEILPRGTFSKRDARDEAIKNALLAADEGLNTVEGEQEAVAVDNEPSEGQRKVIRDRCSRAIQALSAVASALPANDVALLHKAMWQHVWTPIQHASRHMQLSHIDAAIDVLTEGVEALRMPNKAKYMVSVLSAAASNARVALAQAELIFDVISRAITSVPFTSPVLTGFTGPLPDKRDKAMDLIYVHGPNGTSALLEPTAMCLFFNSLRAEGVVKYKPMHNLWAPEDALEFLNEIAEEITIDKNAKSYQRRAPSGGNVRQSSFNSNNSNNNKRKNFVKKGGKGAQQASGKGGQQVSVNAIPASTETTEGNNVDSKAEEYFYSTRPSQAPPLFIVDGVVRGKFTPTLIDMGAQINCCTSAFARSVGAKLRPTRFLPKAANGNAMSTVGEFDLQWSSHSTRFADRGKPTRLALTSVVVVDDELPAPLIIGSACLYGKQPRRVSYTNNGDELGFSVTFDDNAPLGIVRRRRQIVDERNRQCAAIRAQFDHCAPPQASVQVLDETTPLRYPSLPPIPAVLRATQPVPATDGSGIQFGSALVKAHFEPVAARLAHGFIADNETPRVVDNVVYQPLLAHNTDFNSVRQVVPRQSAKQREACMAEAKRLIAAGAARHARGGPFLSTVHAVAKHDDKGNATGKFRFVGSYNYVNQHIIADSYPLPRIDDMVRKMCAGKAFSVIDLTRAYEQIAMAESSVALTTTFYAPGFVLERLSAPFGLHSIPAFFQRTMDRLFAQLDNVVVYLDDIIVIHDDDDATSIVRDVERVLSTLFEAGFVVNAKKLKLGMKRILALGFFIEPGSYEPDEHRIAAWHELPQPNTRKGLRSLLAAMAHYANHFPALAKYTQTLRDLLQGGAGRVRWTPEASDAFVELKRYVSEHAVLGNRAALAPMPPSGSNLLLYTDWGRLDASSKGGVGWVLAYPTADGARSIIACGSKSLPSGHIYNNATRGEIYALQCALRRDRHLLADYKVTWVSDCEPAVNAWRKGSSPVQLIARIILDLQSEWPALDAIYVPREHNPMADMFAMVAPRLEAIREAAAEEVDVAAIRTIIAHDAAHHRYLVKSTTSPHAQWKSARALQAQAPSQLAAFRGAKRSPPLPTVPRNAPSTIITIPNPNASTIRQENPPAPHPPKSIVQQPPPTNVIVPTSNAKVATYVRQIVAAQRDEPAFVHLLHAARHGIASVITSEEFSAAQRAQVKTLYPQIVSGGLLVVQPLSSADGPRIALPTKARPYTITEAHEKNGHFTGTTTIADIERYFWWPNMAAEVKELVFACRTCQEARNARRTADLGSPMLAGTAMHELVIDTLVSATANYNIVTIVDVATRYLWCLPVKKTAQVYVQSSRGQSPATKIARDTIAATRNFGTPLVIRCDNGREFMGGFRDIMAEYGVRIDVSAPYDKNPHGLIEIVHKTITNSLGKLLATTKLSELQAIAEITYRYNIAERSDCKFSPFECMLGRPPPPSTPTAAWLLSDQQLAEATTHYAVAHVHTNANAAVAALQASINHANTYRAELLERKLPAAPYYEVGQLILKRGVPTPNKIDNVLKYTGPWEVKSTSSNNHRLRLGWDGVDVDGDVSRRQVKPYVSPAESRIVREAGDPSTWIVPHDNQVASHWYDDDVLTFEARERHRINREIAKKDAIAQQVLT